MVVKVGKVYHMNTRAGKVPVKVVKVSTVKIAHVKSLRTGKVMPVVVPK